MSYVFASAIEIIEELSKYKVFKCHNIDLILHSLFDAMLTIINLFYLSCIISV